MAEHQISLIDGNVLLAVEDEWPALAASSYGTLHGGAYRIARLAVRRHQADKSQIYVTEVESPGPAVRLEGQDRGVANVNPQWSPDGEWIIFSSDVK